MATDQATGAPAPNTSGSAEERPRCFPEKSNSERCIALGLFLLSALYLCLFRRYTTMEPDEGIVLQGAQRILRGEVLYRDFFSFLTPGSFYLLALIFKIFGRSFLVARTLLVFFGGVFSVLTYLLALRVCSRGSALFVASLVTLTTLPYRFLVLHNWDSTLWACLAAYGAVRWLESRRWIWAFAAGSFLSLTFLFEQSKGAGLGLGLAVGFLAIGWKDRTLLRKDLLVAGGLGLAWPIALTLAYFGAHHSLSPMLADWLWPLEHYSRANRVPYGYQNWSAETQHALLGSGPLFFRFVAALALSPSVLIPGLPLIAAGLWVDWMVQMWRQQAPQAKSSYYVLVGTTLCGLLFSVVTVRADVLHFMYLFPLFGLVLAWIVEGRDIPGKMFEKVQPIFIIYVAIAFLAFSLPLLLRTVSAHTQVMTRRGVVTVPGTDTVIEYTQAHVAPGESILVYPYLPLYYYLTDTYSSTRYEYFQPGMNTPEQAAEMIAELSAVRVRVVLFEASFAGKIPGSWPGTPESAIARDLVADYIMREYRSCRVLNSPDGWHFLFMIRKDLACP